MYKGEALQFTVTPNGFNDAMRLFNKIMKSHFAYLWEQGFSSVIYVDDTLLGGDEFEEWQANIRKTLDK